MEPRTDYRAALLGARNSIDARAAELGTNPCSVILWFTDGRLDVDNPFATPEVAGPGTQAALTEICRPDGIIDQIRRAGTNVIALALFSDAADIPEGERVRPEERDQLRAIVESRGTTGITCGTNQGAAGGYLAANDPASLQALFAGVGAMIQGAIPADAPFPNTSGTISIPTDAALNGIRLIYEVSGGDPVALTTSDGITFDLRAGVADIRSDYDFDLVQNCSLNIATIRRADGLAGGVWALQAHPDTVRVVDVYYFWGIALQVLAPDGLVLGQASNIVVAPTRNGHLDDPALYSNQSLI